MTEAAAHKTEARDQTPRSVTQHETAVHREMARWRWVGKGTHRHMGIGRGPHTLTDNTNNNTNMNTETPRNFSHTRALRCKRRQL